MTNLYNLEFIMLVCTLYFSKHSKFTLININARRQILQYLSLMGYYFFHKNLSQILNSTET